MLYLRQSQCIFAVRIPGNMNMAPVTAHHIARQNLTINFDAGPLKYAKSIHKIINSLGKMLITEKIGHGCTKILLSFH